jgi:outer membrane protein insertion porin family
MPHRESHWLFVVLPIVWSAAILALPPPASGQLRPPVPPPELPSLTPLAGARESAKSPSGQLVVDVIIRGEHTSKDYEIQKHIHTRKDREFDPDIVQSDVRRLITSGLFKDVKTFTQPVEGGVVVIYEVFERPRIREIKFLGNRGFSDKKLLKEIGVKKGDPLNAYAAEESRRKIQEFYHRGGFPQTTVAIFEGDKPGDKDLIFLINEGLIQRISSVSFEGNTISPDGVLRTKIQSKPGYFWYLFGGKVDRSKIDADVQTLTAYYRALGFFRARISRSLTYDDAGKWLTLKFIIDEGPRYKVRNVSVEGGTKFDTDKLLGFLELKSGEFFNQAEASKDSNTLLDLYGSQGHVFADVQPDLRFLEEPGQIDVAYRIKEGEVFKVSEVNVHIAGEFPHTRQTVVLNRVALAPGDLIDIRKVRDSERRLKASQLFAGTQNDGEPPRIVVQPPDASSLVARGQNPESTPDARPAPASSRSPSNIYSWEGAVTPLTALPPTATSLPARATHAASSPPVSTAPPSPKLR